MSPSVSNRRALRLLMPLMALAGCCNKHIYSETSCSIDWVNGSDKLIITTKRDNTLEVAGWAADILSKQAPESVSINLVSSAGMVSEFAEGKLTVARSDVNAALNAVSCSLANMAELWR